MPHPSIPFSIQTEVLRRLRAAEQEHDVRVLWAIESGSRAWGFESPNSDFDARFIYVHRSDWYLSIRSIPPRDVIEYPIVDDLDINGWDLRKAMGLLLKSNPAIVEWLHSPIVYIQHTPFAEEARRLLPRIYSPQAGLQHYLSTAKSNFREYLQGDLVRLKKYFYVLRPLLAARWVARHQAPPPLEFAHLLAMIDGQTELTQAIEALQTAKRAAQEMGQAPKVPIIHRFIAAEIQRLGALDLQGPALPSRLEAEQSLSILFRQLLSEAWS